MVAAALAHELVLSVASCASFSAHASVWLLAQTQVEKRYQIERLDPATRAKVLAALTALVVLMIGLMLLASLGARWARNYGRRTPRSTDQRQQPAYDPDDWAKKPLSAADPRRDESSPP